MNERPTDSSLVEQFKNSEDPTAAQELWERYFGRLTKLARNKMRAQQRRVADEEDVALSAFNSFFRGVTEDRFPQLNDREDLWQILVMLAERKVVDQYRKQNALKRGGGKVRGESALGGSADASGSPGWEQFSTSEPSPELVVSFTETCEQMLAMLKSDELVQVALLKMEGYTNEEIAQKLGRVTRSIERKLHTIRRLWGQESS